MAEALKQQGNQYFVAGDYENAIVQYSLSIAKDGGKNYQLYTNRALAEMKLLKWEEVMKDCRASLALNTRNNIKGYYFLSMAQLEVDPRQCKDALANAIQAYELCVLLHDKSISSVVSQVLKCKKFIWEEKNKPETEAKERLFESLKTQMQQKLDSSLSKIPSEDPPTPGGQIEKEELQREHDTQLELLRETLFPNRVVPNWMIDDISFAVMHDPVMTKNGRSYERATILEHLRRTQTDPVTRVPLFESDLRPNIQLAQACDEYLKENGWAVDY